MNPSTSTIVAPELFNFDKPEEWPKWIRRYGRYRIASGLDKKSETIQVNSLLYTMGDNTADIMMSLVFDPEEDSVKYEKVNEKFDNHFVVKRNTIYERAKFNQRVQGEDDAVEYVFYNRIILPVWLNIHASMKRSEMK